MAKITRYASDILQEYEDAGLEPVEVLRRFRAEHPEHFPKHRNENGEPQTFEALVSHFIRAEKMPPEMAVRAATTRNPRAQQDYYERLRWGAAASLDWVCEGHAI